MSKPFIPRPRVKTNIFENAGRLTVEQLAKLKKKIPIRGFNNLTKEPWWFRDLRSVHHSDAWKGKPTLPDRMSKLLFGLPYLPPQMVTMGTMDGSHDVEAKALLIDCFDLLEDLKNNLDGVTVVSRNDIENYKARIENLVSYLRMSGKILGLIQEGEFALCNKGCKGGEIYE